MQSHMDMKVTDSYPLLDAAEGATETPTVATVPQGVVQAEHIDGAGATAANTSNIAGSSHGIPMSEAAQDTHVGTNLFRGRYAALRQESSSHIHEWRCIAEGAGLPVCIAALHFGASAIARHGLRVLPRRGPRRLLHGLP